MPAESSFELIGEIRAGQGADLMLEPGQAVRIFTGAKFRYRPRRWHDRKLYSSGTRPLFD